MNWNVFFGALRALGGALVTGIGLKYLGLDANTALTAGGLVSMGLAGWSVQSNLVPTQGQPATGSSANAGARMPPPNRL